MIKSPFNYPFKIPIRSLSTQSLWQFTDLGVKNLCWLDFTDSSTMILVDGKISSITDKSVNARIFSQVTAGNRPTFNSTGTQFLRTLDYLVHSYDSAVLTTGVFANLAGGYRIFATVINETESAGSDGVLISESTFNSNSRPYFNAIVKRSDGTIRNRIGTTYINSTGSSGGLTGTTTTTNTSTISLTEYNLISIQDSVTNYKNFINSVENVSINYARSGTLTGTNRTVIGALLNNTTFSSTGGWIIRDILVTTNNLTTDELDRINGSMAWRAGTQAKLPSNHPYRYSPPTSYTGQLFVVDNFNAPNGTNILNYVSSDHNYNWLKQPFNPIENPAIFINNRVRGAGGNNVYYLNYLLPTPNYQVTGVFRVFTASGIAGVTARASNSNNTYYVWRFRDSIVGWELLKRVNGVQTTLRTFSRASVAGEDITATLRCENNIITGLINGVPLVSVTDNDITGAGHAGMTVQWLVGDTQGYHCDSITVRGL